jgi:hypothetical protein
VHTRGLACRVDAIDIAVVQSERPRMLSAIVESEAITITAREESA